MLIFDIVIIFDRNSPSAAVMSVYDYYENDLPSLLSKFFNIIEIQCFIFTRLKLMVHSLYNTKHM